MPPLLPSDPVTLFLLRVPTSEVGHLKHLLEAMDNLCVCSTRPGTPDPAWREVELVVPEHGTNEIRRFLEVFRLQVAFELLSEGPFNG